MDHVAMSTTTSPTHAGGDIAGLIERVKAASGPDRELDFWIETFVADPLKGDEAYTLQDVIDDFNLLGPEGMTIGGAYTASVDAALALVERVLDEDAALELLAMVAVEVSEDTVNGSIKTLPLAILLALLTALQEQSQ